MKFTEQGPSTPGGPNRSYPHGGGSQPVPAAGDHRAWAAWWGEQAVRSIQATEHLEQNMLHAVRSARLAWYHACRVKGYKYWDVSWTRGEAP